MAPVSLTAPNVKTQPRASNQTLEFSWAPPSSDGGYAITSYNILVYGDPAYSGLVFQDSTGPNTFYYNTNQVIPLNNGQTYYVILTATNAHGTTSAPGYFRPFQPGNFPGPPASASAIAGPGPVPNSILVSWTAGTTPDATIFWYVISVINTANGATVKRVTANALTESTYLITGLESGNTYQCKVQSVNCPGYSPPTITNSVLLNNGIHLDLLGTTYNPSNSNAWPDSSGFSNNGTLAGGTATWDSAHNGLVLDGSTYWTAPNLGSFSNNYTVNVWYKDNGTTDFNDTCIITEEYTGSVIQYAIKTGEGTTTGLYAGGFFYNGGFYNGTPFSLTPGIWQNICFTWDGTNIITYIDGSNIGSSNYSGAVALSSGNPIRIGRRWDNANYMTGTIGAVQIYNYALTSGRIGSNYSNDVPTYLL